MKAKLKTGNKVVSRDVSKEREGSLPSKGTASQNNDGRKTGSLNRSKSNGRVDTVTSKKSIVSVFFEWYDMHMRAETRSQQQ